MDKAITQLEGSEQSLPQLQQHLKLCLPLPSVRTRKSQTQSLNLFSVLGFWVSKSVGNLYSKARVSGGFCLRKIHYNGMVVNNSVFYTSTGFLEEEKATMECFMEKKEYVEEMEERVGAGKMETFSDLIEEKGFWEEEKAKMECFMGKNACVGQMEHRVGAGKMEKNSDVIEEKSRDSSSSSDFLTSETTGQEEHSPSSSEGSSFPPSLGWPVKDAKDSHCTSPHGVEDGEKEPFDDVKLEKQSSVTSAISDIELMKERFAKLLLGEDMSGCGNGVSTALAISNAITNLCATLFGQLWRLEPLPQEKKAMWRREIEWLLCVSDHIVELIPTWQTFPDGSKLEVMTCRPRSDLYVNLPALRKLDNMLLEILDSFVDTEFWYIDQGVLAPDGDGSTSFRRALQRQEEKWWLPVPRVPAGGLHENSRKQLQHRRDCTNQILKAAMAINNSTLADMEVPKSYLESLPKNARASLGDLINRYISSEQFSPEYLLTCFDLSSEHHALEIANRLEAAVYIWHKRTNSKPTGNASRSSSRSSWEMVKELMVDADKRELLADRAESLLLCLKQRFPGLPQTTLDMSKIQCNKDVGKSILESYSRVLESLAFNIVARIDDLLYVDDFTKHSDSFSSLPKVGVIAHKGISLPYSVPFPSTPYKSAFTTPKFSPAISSPAKGDCSPFVARSNISQHGMGVKKVLTDYLSIDKKGKDYSNGSSIQKSNMVEELSLFQTDAETIDSTEEGANPKKHDPQRDIAS